MRPCSVSDCGSGAGAEAADARPTPRPPSAPAARTIPRTRKLRRDGPWLGSSIRASLWSFDAPRRLRPGMQLDPTAVSRVIATSVTRSQPARRRVALTMSATGLPAFDGPLALDDPALVAELGEILRATGFTG